MDKLLDKIIDRLENAERTAYDSRRGVLKVLAQETRNIAIEYSKWMERNDVRYFPDASGEGKIFGLNRKPVTPEELFDAFLDNSREVELEKNDMLKRLQQESYKDIVEVAKTFQIPKKY